MASLPLMLLSSVKRKSEVTVRDSDEEPAPPTKLKNRSTVVHNEDGKPKQLFRKRKSISQIDDDDDNDEESYPPRKKVAVTSAKGEPRKKQSKRDEDFEMEESSFEEEDDDEFIDDEEDDVKPQGRRKIPSKKRTMEPATVDEPKPKMAPKPKCDYISIRRPSAYLNSSWIATKASRLAGPSNPGSKEVPDGAPNCLLGLSFVFTGELSSFSREEAIDLAKRFGGCVPSSHPILLR